MMEKSFSNILKVFSFFKSISFSRKFLFNLLISLLIFDHFFVFHSNIGYVSSLPNNNDSVVTGSTISTISPQSTTNNDWIKNYVSTTTSSLSEKSISKLPAITGAEWTPDCPCRQCLYDQNGFRKIVCDSGGIVDIPFERISPLVEVIEITAPNDKPNNLVLGPLFYRFPLLKILRITKSNIPAIGSTTFRYKTGLLYLDLSQNRIEHLIDSNFHGLSQLQILNLSHNHLSELASGTFQQLYNLKYLSLSHNRLNTITTRLFYNLTNLETLDLSNNPIDEITPKNMIDLKPLKHLSLANCQLKQIHSLFYLNLPNLKTFDLRDNLLTKIHSFEFSSLQNLSELYLDRNHLSTISSYAFLNLNLTILSLTENYLQDLNEDTFGNSSIQELNLSDNNFTAFDSKILLPLNYGLKNLKLNNIPTLNEPNNSVARLLLPLKTLEYVELSKLRLDSGSNSLDIFSLENRHTLKFVNLSHNSFVNISSRLIDEMYHLHVLDLSHNSLFELSTEFLHTLSLFKNLTLIFLDHNPWSCYRCHLLSLKKWMSSDIISTTPLYQTSEIHYMDSNETMEMNIEMIHPYHRACQLYQRCTVCRYPPQLDGLQLDRIEEYQLEWCTDPTVQLRVSTTEPNVGFVLALLIIIILMIVIAGVIVYYRNRGAIYITNEELLYGRSSTVGDLNQHHSPSSSRYHKSSAFNVSSAIRHFADATASPPDTMSVTSMDSLYHPHHGRLSSSESQHRFNEMGSMVKRTVQNGQLYSTINRSTKAVGGNRLKPQVSLDNGTGQNNVKTLDANALGRVNQIRQHSADHGAGQSLNTIDRRSYRSLKMQRSLTTDRSIEEADSNKRSTTLKHGVPHKKVLMLASQRSNIDLPPTPTTEERSTTSAQKLSNSQGSSLTTVSSGSGSKSKKNEKLVILPPSTPTPPPPPPPPTSSSSRSSVSSSSSSENSKSTVDEEETETEETRSNASNVQYDEEEDDDEVSSREPSPSGSIDLSPPTELPVMQQKCQECQSSLSSLTTALAENGDAGSDESISTVSEDSEETGKDNPKQQRKDRKKPENL